MNDSDLLLYQTDDGHERIEVRLQDDTVWLSQAAMANLFGTTIPNINIHLKNIFEEEELPEEATIKEYLIVRSEGGRDVQLLPEGPGHLCPGCRLRSKGRGKPVILQNCAEQAALCDCRKDNLDAFLQLNDREVLQNAGKVTKAIADKLALEQYDIFHTNRLRTADVEATLEHEEELRALEQEVSKKAQQED